MAIAAEGYRSAADAPAEALPVAEVMTEELSLRSENVKTFQTDDGGYIATLYDEPVHYYEDAQWKEIDNSLVPVPAPASAGTPAAQTAASAQPVSYVENAANSFKVQLPSELAADKPVVVTCKGHTLAFRLPAVASTPGEVAPAADEEERQQAYAQALLAAEDEEARRQLAQENAALVPNQQASILYENAIASTDIAYEVSGQKLKESLIFESVPAQPRFVFHFTYTGLTPVVQEFGEVHFYAAGEEEPIFVVEAPYMYDAGDALTMAVDVAVEPTDTGCLYTLTPDAGWLRDPARVYPVTLDPTVTTPTDATKIEDCGVNASDPYVNYRTVDRIYVGSNLSGSQAFESRMYVRFERIASIPTTAFIYNATMYLDHYPTASYQTAVNNTLDVYDAGSFGWTSYMTWNTQKDYAFTNRVTSRVSDKSQSIESFNITSLAREWYRTTDRDNSLVIKPRTLDTAKTNRTCFCSSDVGLSSQNKRPRVTIEYYTGSPTAGIESNACYFIRSVYSGKYADAHLGTGGGSGSALKQYTYTGAKNQQFQVQYLGADLYSFIPQHNTSLRIDVPNAGDEDGLNLQLYTANSTKAQMFRIQANGDGSYRISPLCSGSGRVMDVEGPSTADAANLQIWTWYPTANQMRWIFEKIQYGNGGSYRQVNTSKPNCFGYALFVNEDVTPNPLFWPDSHYTEDFSDKFEGAINSEAVSCRRIASYIAPIQANEYRLAVRVPNGLDGEHNYHVIYQLSDGTWAGKDSTAPSQHFGKGNPSISPEMWSNDAYSPSAGTIYFAVRRW